MTTDTNSPLPVERKRCQICDGNGWLISVKHGFPWRTMNPAQVLSNARQVSCRCAIDGDEKPALSAMPGWMPIETAPKDGTEILAYWSSERTHAIVLWSVSDGWWMEESDRAMVSTPTHWMPLPLAQIPQGE